MYTQVLYILLMSVTSLVCVTLGIIGWRRRSLPGAVPFVVLAAATATWSLGYAFELGSRTLSGQIFWAKVEYLGIVVVPSAWLVLVLDYTGRTRWLTRRALAGLSVVPLVTLLLAWTNPVHGLIWSDVTQDATGFFPVLDLTYGAWFWVHVVYSYLLLLIGVVMLVLAYVRSPRMVRGQVAVLLFSALVPGLANALRLLGWSPLSHLDLTAFSFALSGTIAAWGMFYWKLLDVTPVAWGAVVENLHDAVLVLDNQERILDLNAVACEWLHVARVEAIGQPAARALSSWPELAQYLDVDQARGPLSRERGQQTYHYELAISPLRDKRQRTTSRLWILRDVSQQKQAEAALMDQMRLFENLIAVARVTAAELTLGDTLRNVMEVATAITGAEKDSLFVLDELGRVTQSILTRGETASDLGREIVGQVMHKGLAGWSVRHRRPVLVTDTTQDDRWLQLGDEPYSVRSALAVPIVGGPVVLGVLTLLHSQPGYFGAKHVYLMQAAADQMALALRNARMYEGQQRQTRRQTTLYQVLRAVGGHLDAQEIMREAVHAIVERTGWSGAAIWAPQEPGHALAVQAAAGLLACDPGSPAPTEPQIGRRAFDTGQAQHISDVRMDASCAASHKDAHSSLAVPLRRGQRAVGVLIVESEQAHAFDDDDRQLAESLAEAVSLAWSNADLFQATMNEQQRLHTLIQSSRDGIMFVDMDGRVRVVNEAALTLLSLPGQPDEWDGRPLVEVIRTLRGNAPSLARATIAEVRRMQEGSEPAGEGDCEVPPRSIRWLNLPVLAHDLLLGRLLVLHDMTEERLLGRLRDDLTHTMVHDLRNPLTALSMALHYLGEPQSGDLSAQQRIMLDYAVGSLRKMLKLVNNILDVSRLESGQVPLACAPVSIDSLIRDAVDEQSLLAAQRGLRVRTDSPPVLPPVWADTGLMERVLQNLIGNALKFTPSGGLIQVSARVADDGEEVEVSVRDTGPGIPPHVQARLFQKFVTGQQEESGSGLGLVFCKLAVEAHKGRIWVESEPGAGTTFTFALPAAHESISVVKAVAA